VTDDRREALRRTVAGLPEAPGVYLWKDAAGTVLYVGKAKRLRSRVRSYLAPAQGLGPKDQLLRRLLTQVETLVVSTETESLLLENTLIKEHQPRFNVLLRDDKTYPSIAVTLGEPFPRILVTRLRDIPGARYFGPFTDVSDLRTALSVIRRIFTVRTCADDLPRERRDRPCLDYHIKRCRAPCVGFESREHYGAMIREVIGFLEGRTVDVRTRLRDRMADASAREDFESAREIRDTLRWLEQVEAPNTVELAGTGDADVVGWARDGDDAVGVVLRVRDGRVTGREHRFLENVLGTEDPEALAVFLIRYYLPAGHRAPTLLLPFASDQPDAMEALLAPDTTIVHPHRGRRFRWIELAEQNARHLMESFHIEAFGTAERADDPVYSLGRDLGLAVVPRLLACVDISTNQGRDTVGSLVVFDGGRPRKSEYRKFRIQGPGQQDDYAAIHEVVVRYVKRRLEEERPLPDLLVVDGGKGQLGAAVAALAEVGRPDLPVISLAKREEEVFLPGRSEPLRLPRRSPGLRLLQRARDEAHRFGVTYSRKRRAARTLTSELLAIPGVGPRRRSLLIQRFGSLAGVRSASVGEIATLPGFSTRLAERVLEFLKEHA